MISTYTSFGFESDPNGNSNGNDSSGESYSPEPGGSEMTSDDYSAESSPGDVTTYGEDGD